MGSSPPIPFDGISLIIQIDDGSSRSPFGQRRHDGRILAEPCPHVDGHLDWTPNPLPISRSR